MATAAPPSVRIASRTALRLLRRHGRSEADGGVGGGGGGAAKKASKKEDDAPWPRSIRIAFYGACAAAVPLSCGQAVASSPRLRERMVGDDLDGEDEVDAPSNGGGSSAGEVVAFVRRHWGAEDYVAPVDRPPMAHVAPGHRKAWQEDNYSSFLKMLGLYRAEEKEAAVAKAATGVPLSLDNEPPSVVRREQRILSRYLSAETNPTGTRARLTLWPRRNDLEGSHGGEIGGDAGGDIAYENALTLPAGAPLDVLRAPCRGSEGQVRKRSVAESDPAFRSISTQETLRTKHWNEECRWAVDFADSDDGSDGDVDLADVADVSDGAFDERGDAREPAGALRSVTAIHSSWSHFPDGAASSSSSSSSGGTGNTAQNATENAAAVVRVSDEQLQVQRLEHQIQTLEGELRDGTSLRDIDTVREELARAKRELRGTKPWWRRFW